MGIRTTGTDPAIVLYDSVTGIPLQTEVFTTDEEAEAFLSYARDNEERDLRMLTPAELAELRSAFTEVFDPELYPELYRVPYANSMADTAAGPGSN